MFCDAERIPFLRSCICVAVVVSLSFPTSCLCGGLFCMPNVWLDNNSIYRNGSVFCVCSLLNNVANDTFLGNLLFCGSQRIPSLPSPDFSLSVLFLFNTFASILLLPSGEKQVSSKLISSEMTWKQNCHRRIRLICVLHFNCNGLVVHGSVHSTLHNTRKQWRRNRRGRKIGLKFKTIQFHDPCDRMSVYMYHSL